MSSLFSITKRQWIVLAVLAFSVVCFYAGVVPVVAIALGQRPMPVTDSPIEFVMEIILPGNEPPPNPVAVATRRPTSMPTATNAPTPTQTLVPTATPIPPPTRPPAPGIIAPRTLASLELDPKAMLVSKTTFFTSACFGENANPLQDRDNMAPADWTGSPDRKCIFGYNVNPSDGMPIGRYSVFGGPDGQPRFYVIPPEAFAQDQQRIKQLSQVQLIVDPEQGCEQLGSIGVTADGLTYQCSACAFLKAGGICPSGDGSKSIVLPINKHIAFDANDNGGAHGFQNFPAVIFRKGFSLYFTGKSGYAPPRLYFENVVDTLLPSVSIKTTAEMNDREIREISSQFDSILAGADPRSQLAALEQEAQLLSPGQVVIKSKEKAVFHFATTPGTALSSVAWKIRPISNQGNRGLLETNLCLILNGEESCFTGVEDFAHCAFFTPCKTGYSSLDPTAGEGYVATRYFAAGAAPVIHDGKITAKLQAPDIGSVLEVEVQVRIRKVSAALVGQR